MTIAPSDLSLQSVVIFVRDIAESRRFYEGLLGQTVLMDHGPNVGFESGFAIWQAEHASQIIHGRPDEPSRRLGCNNLELYFETDNLDAFSDRVAEGGAEVIHSVREQPWGQRVLRIADPDGHIVEVAEPMHVVVARFASQGLDADAIAARTSMPLGVVRQILQGTAPF